MYKVAAETGVPCMMDPEAFELFNMLGDNFDETTFATDN